MYSPILPYLTHLGIRLPSSLYSSSLVVSVILLILSEAQSFYVGSAGFKVAASLSFLGGGIDTILAEYYNTTTSAWLKGARQISLSSSTCLVLGLAFSVVGDILLIPSPENYYKRPSDQANTNEGESPRFKAGTFSFALAHIAYTISFLHDVAPNAFRKADFVMGLTFGAMLTLWLGILKKTPTANAWFNVPDGMRVLVTAYVSIIMIMVATATATDTGYQRSAGAWTFMVSDLFVAADVFGVKRTDVQMEGSERPGWRRRAIGWVAYFGAQLLLAGCI